MNKISHRYDGSSKIEKIQANLKEMMMKSMDISKSKARNLYRLS